MIFQLLLLVALMSAASLEGSASWTEPFPPHRIAGNLYYVGSKGLASYLITTPQGHILINSNLQSSPPLIEKSVRELGFRFEDIRILLISHAHFDHCAGSASIKRRTHAAYMVMDADVPEVADGGRSNFAYGKSEKMLYPPAHVDRTLHDGNTVEFGGMVLTAHLTPGHTKGCTTWTFVVKQAGRNYQVVIVGSPNLNSEYKLLDNALYPNIAQDYENGFRTLESLPCDIFLGAHGDYYGLLAKYARLKAGEANPFVDGGGYRDYIADRKRAFEFELLQQRVLLSPVPDALKLDSGEAVSSREVWSKQRRPEILKMFSENVYGVTPTTSIVTTVQVDSIDKAALEGTATRKQITLTFKGNGMTQQMHLLLYLPNHAGGRRPVITGLNFFGNQTVTSEGGIRLADLWQSDPKDAGSVDERRRHVQRPALVASRGAYAYRWQVEKLVQRGYGLATAYYGDIEPDFDGGSSHGIRKLFTGGQWGALGAWAWGLSRIADYLVTEPDVDPSRIGVIGFSRLGKAALWAAAQDDRFAFVLSNESGVGGASLYRAKTGESIEHLNGAFPHWFCENFHRYSGHPEQVPVDGNLMLSLIAPRPVYVASAEGDTFSNPQAEFLSAVLASRVYSLLGGEGLGVEAMPPLNMPILHTVSYHERSGKHEVTEFDWDQYLTFLDRQFGGSHAGAKHT